MVVLVSFLLVWGVKGEEFDQCAALRLDIRRLEGVIADAVSRRTSYCDCG